MRRKKIDQPDEPLAQMGDDEARRMISACYDTLEAKIMAGYGPERGRVEIETWRERAEAYQRDYPEIWAEVAAEKKRRKQDVKADSNR